MDFESLKQSSSNFDAITKALETKLSPEDQSNKNKYQDDRFWKPELDKTGNGYAVIRFLPASNAFVSLSKFEADDFNVSKSIIVFSLLIVLLYLCYLYNRYRYYL